MSHFKTIVLKTQNTFKYSIIPEIKKPWVPQKHDRKLEKNKQKTFPKPILLFNENKSNIKTSSSQSLWCLESTLWCFNVWYIFPFPLICHAITFPSKTNKQIVFFFLNIINSPFTLKTECALRKFTFLFQTSTSTSCLLHRISVFYNILLIL